MLSSYNQIIINPNNNPHLPVIYVGDHNVPSLLDWSSDNINQNFGFEIDWPISNFLLNNNLQQLVRFVSLLALPQQSGQKEGMLYYIFLYF